jgi:hypothetical protein
MLKHSVLVLIFLSASLASYGVTVADEELMDCREVDCYQREACNRRILAARAQLALALLRRHYEARPDVTPYLSAAAQAGSDLGMEHWARIAKDLAAD